MLEYSVSKVCSPLNGRREREIDGGSVVNFVLGQKRRVVYCAEVSGGSLTV